MIWRRQLYEQIDGEPLARLVCRPSRRRVRRHRIRLCEMRQVVFVVVCRKIDAEPQPRSRCRPERNGALCRRCWLATCAAGDQHAEEWRRGWQRRRRLRAAREPEPAWRPAATAGGAASCDTRAARTAAAEPANVDGARSSGAAHVAQFDGARGMMCLFRSVPFNVGYAAAAASDA